MGSESDARIRRAIEQIAVRHLPRQWPEDALRPGTRVVIVQDHRWSGPWQREFMGTISDLAAPEPIDQPMTSPGELKYWVKFGEPEYDANAAGPFRGAQIWGRYIRIDEEE